jgi:hypothetical protein
MNSDFESNDNEMPRTLQEYAERHWRDFHRPLVEQQELLMTRPRLIAYETGDQFGLWQGPPEAALACACSASACEGIRYP